MASDHFSMSLVPMASVMYIECETVRDYIGRKQKQTKGVNGGQGWDMTFRFDCATAVCRLMGACDMSVALAWQMMAACTYTL